MICTKCYHHKSCQRRPNGDGHCAYYLKNGSVKLNNNFSMDVNPMDLDDADPKDVPERNGRYPSIRRIR